MSDSYDAKPGVRTKVGNALTRRPKSLLAKILIALLIVLPLAGSAVYMWAMWDPTVYLKNVPIAVSNNDAGGMYQGKMENYGNDVVEGLKAEPYLNIVTTNDKEAADGLLRDQYLFTITIPENFTKDILTVIDPEPKKANIYITYNDYNGSAGAFLTGGLVPLVAASVTESIGEGYANDILVGMNQMTEGLNQAYDGSIQLDDGAAQLRDGAHQLAEGTDQLLGGTDQLGDGMKQISAGVDQLVDMLVPILEKVGTVAPVLKPVAAVLLKSSDPEIRKQGETVQELVNTFNNEDPNGIVKQLGLLKDGAREVSYNLNDPKAPYRGGLLQLREGAWMLADGTDQLKDGTNQMRTGLGDGVQQAPTIKDLAASSNQVAKPFNTNEDNKNPSQKVVGDITEKAPAAGASLLFVVLMGFLLMAVLSMLLPVAMGRRYDSDAKNAFLPVLKAAGLLALVGIVVVGLMAAASTGVGWKPANGWAMAGILILIGISAGTSYMFWRTLFGRLVGGIASLAAFMLGVFSFGGVWPLSTTPALFRHLHPIHPMSYARGMFTLGTDGIYNNVFWTATVVLVVMIVLTIILSGLVRWFQLAATTPEALEAKAEAAIEDKAEPVTA